MIRNKSFDNTKPTLYLIASPIGNLKEFTPRAIEIISESTLVASEDTRNTSSLLLKFNISKPMVSLREHNERQASQYVVSKIKEGEKVVYLSDAGYPGISDPGQILVDECIKNDINVSIVAGSSAFLAGLVASGLDTAHFYFYGFLPIKPGKANKELEMLKPIKDTLIFYESPHRIIETLNLLYKSLGNRKAVIARELTKINEEYIRGNLEELISIDPNTLKGEMVIIVEGNKEEENIDDKRILDTAKLLKEKGLSNRDIVELISKIYNIPKNNISKLLY